MAYALTLMVWRSLDRIVFCHALKDLGLQHVRTMYACLSFYAFYAYSSLSSVLTATYVRLPLHSSPYSLCSAFLR